MKITAMVGNPPYNEYEVTGSHVNSTKCLYYRFMGLGISNYECLIVPSRWISDIPKGISADWLYKFRTRKDIKVLIDYKEAGQIFDGVGINGGICIYLLEDKYIDLTERKYITDKETQNWIGKLVIKDDIILRDYYSYDIVSKIDTEKVETLDSRISGTNPFMKDRAPQCAFSTTWTGYKDHKDEKYNIKCYGKKIQNGYGWVSREQIEINEGLIDKHKILLDNVQPTDSRVIMDPLYAEPGSCCLSSWQVLECNRYEEAQHIIKYLKSKLVRFLIQCIKNTPHASRGVYKLVPIPYNIDWNEDVDTQLYKRYNLTEQEVSYIENKIQEI